MGLLSVYLNQANTAARFGGRGKVCDGVSGADPVF